MKFVLQKTNSKVLPDFQSAVILAKEFMEWWQGTSIELVFSDYTENLPPSTIYEYVPVGSVEWVVTHFKGVFGKEIKPRNIPQKLQPWEHSGRLVQDVQIKSGEIPWDLLSEDIQVHGSRFYVKSNDHIKYIGNGAYTDVMLKEPWTWKDGSYQISTFREMNSEYRVFIYKGEIIDIKNYSGDPFIVPDRFTINQLIAEFGLDAPPAYTLDVYESNGNWYILEVHDFFSCGLYGFNKPEVYLQMLYQSFIYLKTIKN